MGKLKFYKGVAADYNNKKDKIANGGFIMVKDNDSSVTGSLYINDEGTHVQVSTDKSIIEVNYADGKLNTRTLNGNSVEILNVDDTLNTESINPIQNKTVAQQINSLTQSINENAGSIEDNYQEFVKLNEDFIVEKNKISSAETNINNLSQSIGTLQTEINVLNEADENLQTLIEQSNVEIGKHEQAIDNLENSLNDLSSITINGKPLNDNIVLEPADIGATTSAEVALDINAHNVNNDAHNDIRLLIEEVTTRLNALANSTDVELDQMAELVEYIKDNRELIEGVTTNKINVSDIIDNLTTNVSDKPLSAAQGTVLKKLIDELQLHIKTDEQLRDLIEEQVKVLTPEVVVCTSEHYESLGTTPLTDGKIYFIQK